MAGELLCVDWSICLVGWLGGVGAQVFDAVGSGRCGRAVVVRVVVWACVVDRVVVWVVVGVLLVPRLVLWLVLHRVLRMVLRLVSLLVMRLALWFVPWLVVVPVWCVV